MSKWLPGKRRQPPPVLDQAFLGRVSALVGRADMQERLSDGLLELSDLFDRVAEAVESADNDKLAEAAQDISTIAGHLGLSALASASAETIRQARRDISDTSDVAATLLGQRGGALEALARHSVGHVKDDEPS